MAKGKIIYPPIPTVCLLFDEGHYASLASPDFNAGTGHFGVDALITIDPAVTDSESWIAGKGASNLANLAGWHWYYKKTSRRLGLRINDGGATPLVMETADNQIPALGTTFWGRLQTDRAGQVRFYVNGVDAGGGSIAAKAGSLDNSEPFKVGANDVSTNRHKGSLDFLRFDLGRILPAAWHEEEWYRIKYGWPREAQDFLAFWIWYGESLADRSAAAYTLAWQGGGSPGYTTGWPGSAGSISYPFAKNFVYGDKPGYLDLDDRQRMLDASDFSYPHPNPKKTFLWQFKNIAPEQQAAFIGAWASKQPVRLYRDEDQPQTAVVKIITYPLQESIFRNLVNAELDMEEV